jgi:hypothetical protein
MTPAQAYYSIVMANKTRFTIIITVMLLTSCSTVERRSYYSPDNNIGTVQGPEKQYCGITQFSEKPDAVIYDGVRYNANESYEPYLWGPWLITIIPVFPITWIADIFINPDLKITYSTVTGNSVLPKESEINIDVKQDDVITNLKPNSVVVTDEYISATFPVEANEVVAFDVPTTDGTKLHFSKTSRWAWTQICVN